MEKLEARNRIKSEGSEERASPLCDEYENRRREEFHHLFDSNRDLQTLVGPLQEEIVVREKCRVGTYKLVQQIGKGSFGEVWEAKQRRWSSTKVAVKKFDKLHVCKDSRMKMLTTELKLMSTLKHKNLITARGIIQGRNSIYVIMEKAAIDLHTYLDSQPDLTSKSAKVIATGALRGLAYLHENKVAHMDIKASNVLVVSDVSPDQLKISDIKLCDLGLAIVGNEDGEVLFDGFRGTPLYAAPETRFVKRRGLFYDCRKADMWSMGVMTMDLINIVPVKWETLLATTTEDECRASYNVAMTDFWNQLQHHEGSLQHFLYPLLHFDPEGRPTASVALRSPWIRGAKAFWRREQNSFRTEQPHETAARPRSQLNSVRIELVLS